MRLAAREARNAAFTLIELLVVMAITVILLGLIFGPLVQGFNLTNRARVQVLTQDTARRVMETGIKDLANSVFVFDNTDETLNFWIRGQSTPLKLPYASIDVVPPMRYIDQVGPTLLSASDYARLTDPTTGLPIEDRNELIAALRQIFGNNSHDWLADTAIPIAPGRVIVRYWLGLRDNTSTGTDADDSRPVKPYANFYDDTRNLTLNDHNPYILYRAVVSPYLQNGAVDTRFFETKNGQPVLFHKNFFYDNSTATSAALGWKDLNKDGKVSIAENWAAIARPMVPTDRADEVVVQFANGRPDYTTITPLVRLQPTYVGGDAAAPTSTTDVANEAALGLMPGSYTTEYGHWTQPFRLSVITNGNSDYYQWDGLTGVMHNGQATAGWDPLNPGVNLSTVDPTTFPVMFSVDFDRGVVNFSFPDSLFDRGTGTTAAIAYDPGEINAAYSATREANGGSVDSAYHLINLKVAPTSNGGQPGSDLMPLAVIPNARIVPGSDVVTGPDMLPGPHYGHPITYTRVMRAVTDPSALGPNEYMINYTKQLGNATPQNVMDQALLEAGTIVFRNGCDGHAPAPTPQNPAWPATHTWINWDDPVVLTDPATRKPANFGLPNCSADATGALTAPAAPVTVSYKIQNNGRGDLHPRDPNANNNPFVVKVDYLTRELMTFSLGVRLYDFNSGQPQQVTLTQKVKIRNTPR